jgi:hypothetical protein
MVLSFTVGILIRTTALGTKVIITKDVEPSNNILNDIKIKSES